MHASPRDARSLLNRRTEDTDALFVEGRSDVIRLEHYTLGYLLFLLGYLSIEVIYRASEWLHEVVPGGEEWSVEAAGIDAGLNVDSEIDAELDEIWSLAEGSGRTGFYGFALLIGAYAVWNSIFGTPVFGIPAGLISVIIAIGTPLMFSGFVILLLGRGGVRDEIMADSIIEACERESYSEVLVLCGDKHVPGISEKLRDDGWEVDEERSDHLMSRIPRVAWKFI